MASVLLIEDEADVRDTLRRAIESGGHVVRCAADGNIGLQSFQENRPDVVVTDIIMPNREGLETIRAMRAEAPSADHRHLRWWPRPELGFSDDRRKVWGGSDARQAGQARGAVVGDRERSLRKITLGSICV